MNVYLHGYASSASRFKEAWKGLTPSDERNVFLNGNETEPLTGLRRWFPLSGREEGLADLLGPCAERLENELHNVLSAAGAEHVSLFGHSQGGMIALELARRGRLPVVQVDAFAAYLPAPLMRTCSGSGTPSIALHLSLRDPYIDCDRVHATASFFRMMGCKTCVQARDDLPHAFSREWLTVPARETVS